MHSSVTVNIAGEVVAIPSRFLKNQSEIKLGWLIELSPTASERSTRGPCRPCFGHSSILLLIWLISYRFGAQEVDCVQCRSKKAINYPGRVLHVGLESKTGPCTCDPILNLVFECELHDLPAHRSETLRLMIQNL